MTDRTNRLALAAAEALHALAEALTDWAEDGLPDRAASDRYAANEERQREEELEDAWQSRDWETVRRLQDEDEQRGDGLAPDPLDENDHRDRIDRDGNRWHWDDGGWRCTDADGFYHQCSTVRLIQTYSGGPLAFAPDAAPDAPRADLTASEAEVEVSLEWDANDEGPPCIDFTCPCGHWRHLCDGPDWITEGLGQVPGVECVKCGRAWSLYRVRTTAMIREARP